MNITRPISLLFVFAICIIRIDAQDLSYGLAVNDMANHPMQDIAKPGYLQTITDPSFGTTIRRITDAGDGNAITPLYSTIQPWNADESLMIVYNVSTGQHLLLNGMTYEFIRILDDIDPDDLENIFWDYENPEIFHYLEDYNDTYNFVSYNVNTHAKEYIVNLHQEVQCPAWSFSMGDDVQMMPWDSDIFTFRCANNGAYYYRISTGDLVKFNLPSVEGTAPTPFPSGNFFYHGTSIYDNTGTFLFKLNEKNVEHSCHGKLPNGHDAHFAVAFDEGPQGGCFGNIVAHDITTGDCFNVISENQGYDYPKSGTHISALAHKNTEGGWVAASMIGFAQNGQTLLDQELVIAKAELGNIKVCRIGHHRSDEDQFDYWGEPHASISPTGTRVLFASDWSGSEDGKSLDCYVVELPSFTATNAIMENFIETGCFKIYPNPVSTKSILEFDNPQNTKHTLYLYNSLGMLVEMTPDINTNQIEIKRGDHQSGMHFFVLTDNNGTEIQGKIIFE